jgi:hypothetical protein
MVRLFRMGRSGAQAGQLFSRLGSGDLYPYVSSIPKRNFVRRSPGGPLPRAHAKHM